MVGSNQKQEEFISKEIISEIIQCIPGNQEDLEEKLNGSSISEIKPTDNLTQIIQKIRKSVYGIINGTQPKDPKTILKNQKEFDLKFKEFLSGKMFDALSRADSYKSEEVKDERELKEKYQTKKINNTHELHKGEDITKSKFNKYLDHIFSHKPDEKLDFSPYRKYGIMKKMARFLLYPMTFFVDCLVVFQSYLGSYAGFAHNENFPNNNIQEVKEKNGKVIGKYIIDTPTEEVMKELRIEKPRGTIVYFHGNGHYLNKLGSHLAESFTNYGYNVIVMEYPGYSKIPGPKTRENIMQSINKTFEHIKASKDTPEILFDAEVPLISMGTSIGGYYAARFTNEHDDVQGLFLQNTYSNQIKSHKMHVDKISGFTSFFSNEVLDTKEMLETMRPEVSVMISGVVNDEFFNHEKHSVANYKASNALSKECRVYQKGTHNSSRNEGDLEALSRLVGISKELEKKLKKTLFSSRSI